MQLTILRSQLLSGLEKVGRAVNSRSTLPVLAHVFLEACDNRLSFFATDLETGIVMPVSAEVKTPGRTTVPAGPFTEYAKTLPTQAELTLTLKDGKLTVKSGASKASFATGDPGDYPPRPTLAEADHTFTLLPGVLKDLLRQTLPVTATDEARAILTGVQFDAAPAQLTLRAADGFRACVAQAGYESLPLAPFQAVVTARSLREVLRLLDGTHPEAVQIIADQQARVAFLLAEGVIVFAQTLAGEYPDVDQVVPKTATTEAVLSVEAFIRACKQMRVAADKPREALGRLDLQNSGANAVKVTAEGEILTASETTLTGDVTVTGQSMQIALNLAFVLDMLEVIKTSHVRLKANAPNTPVVLTPEGVPGLLYVIMPMVGH
ncbi:MAG: DNA polymerase III subunit beta [Anaerolineales bacterium]|nr:DNA polymerase III subunit beta [Anaerolineales bacterium]